MTVEQIVATRQPSQRELNAFLVRYGTPVLLSGGRSGWEAFDRARLALFAPKAKRQTRKDRS